VRKYYPPRASFGLDGDRRANLLLQFVDLLLHRRQIPSSTGTSRHDHVSDMVFFGLLKYIRVSHCKKNWTHQDGNSLCPYRILKEGLLTTFTQTPDGIHAPSIRNLPPSSPSALSTRWCYYPSYPALYSLFHGPSTPFCILSSRGAARGANFSDGHNERSQNLEPERWTPGNGAPCRRWKILDRIRSCGVFEGKVSSF
jgi:hypothetical protein